MNHEQTVTASPPTAAKKPRKGLAVLAGVVGFIVYLLLSGCLSVVLFQGYGYSGQDLLKHDPMNLLPVLFGAGVGAGLALFLVVSLIFSLYVLLPKWLRTKTLKGTP